MLTRLLLLLGALASPAAAGDCAATTFDGARYTTCTVNLTKSTLRTFLRGPDGRPFGSFAAVDAALAAGGERLGVAMNGGMYNGDRTPVGLYVEDGQELNGIVTRDGPGNFGLLPNGVLCIGEGRAAILESRTFAADPPACRFATQSGPMLVRGGALHPRFIPGGASRHIRNGVGVSADGRSAVLAISDEPVNFHDFARLFRDRLGTPDALYLDGSISRLHAPAIGRDDRGFAMGPILGTVVPAD